MARCLVTGHEGYIGSKLYKALNALGHEVCGVDMASFDVGECLDIRSHLFHNGKPWLKFRPEYIFHLAAKPSVPWSVEFPSESLSHNVLGSSRVLEFAKKTGTQRVIFASSAAAYEASSPYGLHKLMTEKECKLYSHLYGIDTVSLRYFNVYSADQKFGGPYSTVISAWMEALRSNTPLRVDGDGAQTRDFVHVSDVILANVFCMEHKEKFDGATYDVGTGIETSISQIREYINNNFEVLWNEVPSRHGDIKNSCANTKPLKEIGWAAKTIPEEGIKNCFQSIMAP